MGGWLGNSVLVMAELRAVRSRVMGGSVAGADAGVLRCAQNDTFKLKGGLEGIYSRSAREKSGFLWGMERKSKSKGNGNGDGKSKGNCEARERQGKTKSNNNSQYGVFRCAQNDTTLWIGGGAGRRGGRSAGKPSAGRPVGEGLLGGGDAHGEVDGGGGVGEGSDGDEVDAGFGVGADGFEVHVAGGFDGRFGEAGADLGYGLFDLFGCHVVEQDGFGAAGDGLLEFFGGADFYLDDLAGLAVLRGPW